MPSAVLRGITIMSLLPGSPSSGCDSALRVPCEPGTQGERPMKSVPSDVALNRRCAMPIGISYGVRAAQLAGWTMSAHLALTREHGQSPKGKQLRIGKKSFATGPTRRWTPEESAAFEASLNEKGSDPRPELATVRSLPEQEPMRCAGCGLAIERGQPRLESWAGWTEGEPLPERPERAWHGPDCLREDEERRSRRRQR
jgi:hypothetical protein